MCMSKLDVPCTSWQTASCVSASRTCMRKLPATDLWVFHSKQPLPLGDLPLRQLAGDAAAPHADRIMLVPAHHNSPCDAVPLLPMSSMHA